MTTIAEVRLWSSTIGALALVDGHEVAAFEYDPAFARSGIQVAPIAMPLSKRVYRFPELARRTFFGLPGMLADALPDRFGHAVIDAWLATQGRSPDSFNAVERLCLTGERGMGALEFRPSTGPRTRAATLIQVDRLAALAADILAHRGDLRASFDRDHRADALRDILRVGTSAGGARAKAVIAWNPMTNEVRSGQADAPEGFEHWLLKLDGVGEAGEGGTEAEGAGEALATTRGHGAIEYAYARMAQDAGVTMSACRLLEVKGRRHFMTRRFDRLADGSKVHMQSLGALGHLDYNLAGVTGYEQALSVMRRLGLPMESLEQMFRRMVFNVVARNQDDHVKNVAFLMDRRGRWSLAPAFDLTFAHSPAGLWTSRHQMTINGKSDELDREDFRACARSASLRRRLADDILAQVQRTVSRWRDYADEARVAPERRDLIQAALRLAPFA